MSGMKWGLRYGMCIKLVGGTMALGWGRLVVEATPKHRFRNEFNSDGVAWE